jgi:UDP-N-acetylmuramate: L-alanyl-gamma-D-glutamyl-meso-diaminopimelate ligase
MSPNPKHIHFIGICGVATSALAIAFHNAGYKVTGSDKGFFPPVSDELEKHKINFYAGWHPENMGNPDFVVVGTASGTQNPETNFAKENNIPIYSYPEAIGKFFVKEYSIVTTGTWGKTSSTALLSFIFEQAKLNPSYMFGGISLSHESSAKLTDTKYSIFEGDEYKSSPTDITPKFVYYKPTHLLLSAVSWDHADLYPTEESYFNVFKNLISNIPNTGLLVVNSDNEKAKELVQSSLDKKVIWYGKENADYIYSDLVQNTSGLNFKITYKENTFKIHSEMIGSFQAENITGCFAMAHSIGINPDDIIKAIANFKGLKRRLEKRYAGKVTIFDDIAHSPEKAKTVLDNIKKIYSGKVIAIFEPNIGGRSRESVSKYNNAFLNADVVIIPRLTKLKIAENSSEQPMDGEELALAISKTNKNVIYIEDDNTLVSRIVEIVKDLDNTKNNNVIAFLGSHGFRGMIEQTITSLHQQSL